MNEELKLFQQGVAAFNERRFYDAHEYWEEIWLNHKLADAKCIQGLIQHSVSFFHYHNGNPKGAKSMAAKCIKKFDEMVIFPFKRTKSRVWPSLRSLFLMYRLRKACRKFPSDKLLRSLVMHHIVSKIRLFSLSQIGSQ